MNHPAPLRGWKTAFAAAGLALLSACSLLPNAEPVDTYLLPGSAALSATPTAKPASAVALQITRPASGIRLSGQRIVVVPEDNRISVYKGAHWSDPAPILVRNRLLDAFRADGRIVNLSTDDPALQFDLELNSDLRAFQSEYRNGLPEVVIVLDARLVRPDLKRIVATQRFEIHQPATGTAVPQVVQAFGLASNALSSQVVHWVTDYVQAGHLQRGK